MQIHSTSFAPTLTAPAPRAPGAESAGAVAHAAQPAAEQVPDVRGVGATGIGAETGEEQRQGPGTQAQQTEQDEQAAVAEQVRALAARDREVRAHERAHMSAAGGLARGGISLDTERGPDGRQYAVGGEVHIDTSAVAGDPRATIARAQQVRRAALAPADPSPQDRNVAAQAAAMETAARAELAAGGDEVDTGTPVDGERSGDRGDVTPGDGGTPAGGAEPCPMCGGGDHGRGDHVAGNERRLAAGLAAAAAVERGPGLDLTA